MKFSATKDKILQGLQQVQNVVSTRTTLPILSNVLLQAKEGATPLHHHSRAAVERNISRGRWQKRGFDSQRPEFFQNPRIAGRGISTVAEV